MDARSIGLDEGVARRILMRGPASDHIREHFLIHRVVCEPEGWVGQVAACLLQPAHDHPPLFPDGVPLSAYRGDLPGGRGRRLVGIDRPGADPVLSGLNEALRRVACREITGVDREEESFDPDHVILALEDDRVCGYITGGRSRENLVRIDSTPGGIRTDRAVIVPAMEGLDPPGIGMAWVAARHRRGRLALTMMAAMARRLASAPARLLYMAPFTAAGFGLVRRFAGPRFLAGADQVVRITVPLADEEELCPAHVRTVVGDRELAATDALRRAWEAAGLRPRDWTVLGEYVPAR